MTADRIVFDLSLGARTLLGGAALAHMVARVWLETPATTDRFALAASGAAIWEHDQTWTTERVVRRDEATALACSPSVRLDPAVPTVLVIHALTGDMRAGGPGGWWEPMIGPGRPLDTARYRVVCINNLGSCYGTTGPADAGFPARAADTTPATLYEGPGAFATEDTARPATVTTWDQAQLLLDTLQVLGIGRLALVVGGSVGGMIATMLAALAPDQVAHVVPVAACTQASPWILGWNHIARQTLLSHADPQRGLELARQIAHLTYRADAGLTQRQGRRMADQPDGTWSSTGRYAIGTYLELHGQRLRARFDASAYLAQLDAMDHHDVAGQTGVQALGGPRTRLTAIGIDSDALFLLAYSKAMVAQSQAAGWNARLRVLASPHGHDAFLIEWDALGPLLSEALAWTDDVPPAAPSLPLASS